MQTAWLRDAEGRIRDLVLPDGEIISYTYTPAGDLASVTDAADQTTQFQYTEPRFAHYLTGIVDPRGVRVVRNEYDDDGRLVATIDADGNRVAFTRDIDGRIEQVHDRRGNLLTYVYADAGRVLAETNVEGETPRERIAPMAIPWPMPTRSVTSRRGPATCAASAPRMLV